jgi:hypothetical protein
LFSFVPLFNQQLPNRRGRGCLEGGHTFSRLASATASGAEKFLAVRVGLQCFNKDGDRGRWFLNTSHKYNWFWGFLVNHLSSGARESSHRHLSSGWSEGGTGGTSQHFGRLKILGGISNLNLLAKLVNPTCLRLVAGNETLHILLISTDLGDTDMLCRCLRSLGFRPGGLVGGEEGSVRRRGDGGNQLQLGSEKGNMDETHDQISTCICTVDRARGFGGVSYFLVWELSNIPKTSCPDFFARTQPYFGLSAYYPPTLLSFPSYFLFCCFLA